jgi:hypothetical protein
MGCWTRCSSPRRRDAFENVFGEILGRRLQLIKRRQLIDVAVIEIVNQFISRRLQLNKVDEQPNVVQLATASVDLNLIVVSVQVFALPLVAAQLVRAREVTFNHDFKLSRHGESKV